MSPVWVLVLWGQRLCEVELFSDEAQARQYPYDAGLASLDCDWQSLGGSAYLRDGAETWYLFPRYPRLAPAACYTPSEEE